MELLSFNKPSLTIKILSSDGKYCEFIIFLKAKAFYNYSSKFVLSLTINEENQDLHKRGSFGITQDFIVNLQKLVIYHFKKNYAKSWDLRRSWVVVPKLREFVEQEKFPIGKAKLEQEIQEEKNDNEGENIRDNSRVMKMMKNYDKTKLFLIRYTFQAATHCLWRERNTRRHGNDSSPPIRLVKFLDKTVRNRLSTISLQGNRVYADGLATWFGSRTNN